jgi:hypothetical protein
MRSSHTMSPGQWHVMTQQREEMAGWLSQLRVELDTRSGASDLQRRFDDLAKEYHEIELLMAN